MLRTNVDALGITDVSTASKAGAQQNLASLDVAITKVNESRSELGALQNRLASTINNLAIYRENLEQANSRIRDTDMAEEVTEMTKTNILTNATISVLGQANQAPQAALKLLS
jgi:flagellin